MPFATIEECPFYKDCERQRIRCEGVWENTAIHLAFGDATDLKEYKLEYCCGLWKNCRIARMLIEKYEEEDNG